MVICSTPVTVQDHARLDGNASDPIQAGLDVYTVGEEILHRVVFQAGGRGS